ncbi:DUF3105 domain-containing protein [Nocardia australiensis]|uniref:DUF3105 domain-containing protein n=1 Tax=Nocardia australiensis TaxID=2887191 RepID=UPI001D143FA0|nr:DUF3105 domain-containing protein [Nocardia australiensis]
MPSPTSAKSAKTVKAAGKSSSSRQRGGKNPLQKKRQVPWLAIGAVVVVLALVGVLAYSLVPKYIDKADLEKFTPSAEKKDPSDQIEGVTKKDYPAGLHVTEPQRVAYDQSPPFGGPHDQAWANCTGVVYSKPIRLENAVHSLEHGAVWVTYNPDKVDSAGIDSLKQKVEGKQQTMMSPYPGLPSAISLQSWGHELKLDNVDDKRVNQFLTALRGNPYAYPEVGASCSNPSFDANNPLPYDPTPPGPDAVPMDGKGLQPDLSELGGGSGLPGGMPGLPGGMPGLPGGMPGLPGGLPGVPGVPSLPGAGGIELPTQPAPGQQPAAGQ